jgi:hypothetical protein
MTRMNPEADTWLRVESACGVECARIAIACQVSGDRVPLHVSLWLACKSEGEGEVAKYAERVVEYFIANGQLESEAA